MDREEISAEIHKCYCRAYKKRFGNDYWTKGDYSLLDEAVKDYDREMADWHIKQMESRTPPSGGEEILAVVKKAVEMGLVRIEMCEACRGSGDLITDFSEYDICKNCSGNGFTITEGDAK